jgi:single-strand DNA-binding protein
VAPPEQLTTKSGKLFCKAVIATSVHQKNGDGASEERTSFIPVTIFGRTAEIFCQYVQKGDVVHLIGRLDSNEYTTNSGDNRLSLSCVAESLQLLPNNRPKPAGEPDTTSPRSRPDARRQTADKALGSPRTSNYDENGDPSEIPF